jgi:hypothetical protein
LAPPRRRVDYRATGTLTLICVNIVKAALSDSVDQGCGR